MTAERIAEIEQGFQDKFWVCDKHDLLELCRLARLGLVADSLANSLSDVGQDRFGVRPAHVKAALNAYRKAKETTT